MPVTCQQPLLCDWHSLCSSACLQAALAEVRLTGMPNNLEFLKALVQARLHIYLRIAPFYVCTHFSSTLSTRLLLLLALFWPQEERFKAGNTTTKFLEAFSYTPQVCHSHITYILILDA